MEYNKNLIVDLRSFYTTFNNLKINEVNFDKLNEIKEEAKKLNYFYEGKFSNLMKSVKYTRVLNRIKTNPKGFNLTNSTEILLMVMFSIDPNFEAIKIHNEYNKISETKFAMEKHFGIYDSNLIKIEIWYIKNILDKESKISLEKEIEKRIYKI